MQTNLSTLKKILTPPGNGVFTINTNKELKEELHLRYYQTTFEDEIQRSWQQGLNLLEKSPFPTLIGMCSDNGGGIQRGANWGPLFIRNHYLKQSFPENFFDVGDIRIIPHLLHDKYLNEQTITECQKALYPLGDKLPVSPLSLAEKFCEIYYQSYHQPILMLGGDHSVSYPFVSEFLKHQNTNKIKTAVIHFDAHTDLLNKRLGIDLCFGSWAYHILPLLASPHHLVQLGIRSSGKDRGHWESTLGVKQLWSSEINQETSEHIVKAISNHLKKDNITHLYISFDIDALDEKFASATGTPEKDGLDLFHSVAIIQGLAKEFTIASSDIVEVAPFVQKSANKFQDGQTGTLNSASIIMNTLLEAMYKK